MFNSFQRISLLLLSLTLLLLFAACESDPAPKENHVRVILRGEPQHLSPIRTATAWSSQITEKMFPTLMKYHQHTMEFTPMLAKSAPEIKQVESGPYEGGTSYTLEILDEAVWENGSPVQASDYIFTYKIIFNPLVKEPGYKGYLQAINDIVIDEQNPKRFTVYVKEPYIRSTYVICNMFIYPEYHYDPDGLMKNFSYSELRDLGEENVKRLSEDPKIIQFAEQFHDIKYSRDKNFISNCGPYQMDEWVEGEKIVLKRKENWWGDKMQNLPYLLSGEPDKITYMVAPEWSTCAALMKNGEADVLGTWPVENFLELKENEYMQEHFHFYTPATDQIMYIGLNNRIPKLSDKRVRKALAHLVDIDEVVKTVQQGMAKPTDSPIGISAPYYNKDLETITLNIEKAKALLAEAGWADSNNDGTLDKMINGEQTEMVLTLEVPSSSKVSEQIYRIWERDAKKAGVRIEMNKVDGSKYMAPIHRREFEMFTLAMVLDRALYDPYQLWHTDNDVPGGGNRSGFGNEASNTLIEKIRTTLDEKELYPLYKEFQEVIYEEQPMIFLYQTKDRIILSKRFANAAPSSMKPGYFENHFTLAE